MSTVLGQAGRGSSPAIYCLRSKGSVLILQFQIITMTFYFLYKGCCLFEQWWEKDRMRKCQLSDRTVTHFCPDCRARLHPQELPVT